jgi:APA family basic amino acid/polyamine antiporter
MSFKAYPETSVIENEDPKMTEQKTGSSPTGLFQRRATGLVREWSFWNIFHYGYLACPYTIFLATIFLWLGYSYPGANLELAILLCAIGAVFSILPYVAVISSFPRSGFSYVAISRILHPAIGYALACTFYLITTGVWQAYTAWFILEFGVTPGLLATGWFTHNAALIQTGLWSASPTAWFILGSLFIFGSYLLLVPGLKYFFKAQWIMFIIMIAMSVLSIGVLAFSNTQTFIANFNSFVSIFHPEVTDAYHTIITNAQSAGANFHPSFSLWDTLLLMPYVWFGVFYPVRVSGEVMGEVKRANDFKRISGAMVGATLLGLVFMGISAALLPRVVGTDFIMALSYLYSTGAPTFMPTTPYFLYWALLLSPGVIVMWIIAIGFGPAQMAFGNSTNMLICPSRSIFAMAFDRMFPKSEWLTSLNKKYRSPLNVYSVLLIWFIVLQAIWVYYPNVQAWLLFGTFVDFLMLTVVDLTCIIFPYRMPTVFKASPISKYKVAGIPAVTIIGIIGTLFNAGLIAGGVIQPAIGIALGISPQVLISVTLIAVSFFLLYWVIRAYRKSQGMDIDLAYKTIPPE